MGKVHDYMLATGLTYDAARWEIEKQEEQKGIHQIEARMDTDLTTIRDSKDFVGLCEWLMENVTPHLAELEHKEREG